MKALLVCPETRLPLVELPLEEAEHRNFRGERLLARSKGAVPPVGRTPTVQVRVDNACAYPMKSGVPILLAPERLSPESMPLKEADLSDPRYAEAYLEMDHYNTAALTAERSDSTTKSESVLAALVGLKGVPFTFPDPPHVWLDAVYEPAAQLDAYRHLAPLLGTRILQIGGKGTDALKFLIAGAEEAFLLTPMLGEINYTVRLARKLGLEESFTGVVGVAEEMPFPDAKFDCIISNGSLHHTVPELSAPELKRVLRPGGRIAAVEPWQAPFYKLGTKLFGRRESGVGCRIFTKARMQPLMAALDDARLVHHAALTRYPLLALDKLGLHLQLSTVSGISRIDDAICSLFPPLRRRGSIVALLGSR